jgi:hypothetical protein
MSRARIVLRPTVYRSWARPTDAGNRCFDSAETEGMAARMLSTAIRRGLRRRFHVSSPASSHDHEPGVILSTG